MTRLSLIKLTCLLCLAAMAAPLNGPRAQKSAAPKKGAPGKKKALKKKYDPLLPRKTLRISPHTRVQVPAGYRLRRARTRNYAAPGFRVRLFARRFAQGEAVYMEIRPRPKQKFPKAFSASFMGRAVPLTRRSWGLRAIFPIAPWAKPGRKRLRIYARYRAARGARPRAFDFRPRIRATRFPVYKRSMDLGRFSNNTRVKKSDPDAVRKARERREFIARSARKKRMAFKRVGPDMLSARLSHPRDKHKITSPFFAKRVKQRYVVKKGKRVYRKPRVSRHGGVDLYGWIGHPIFGVARGKVVIARPMYYEGNYVLLDHGLGVFSGYFHMSEILVREGQVVEAGHMIGRSGKTGAVTGPHLHLMLWIRGVILDGLSLLHLPIRDQK